MANTFDQLIQQLQSSDPDQRSKAIKALANSKNPAALPHLAEVYRRDPEPSLRDLALKAGRYIRQASAEAGAGAGASAGPSAGTGAGTQGRAAPTARDIEVAKSYQDAATNYLLAEDKGRAIDALGKALALNPALADEAFTQNLIMSVTGLAPAQAIPILIHPDRREQLINQAGGKRKLKQVETHHGAVIEDVTWTRILMDLAGYWVASALSSVVVLFFLLDMMDELLAQSGYPVMFDLDLFLSASLPALILSSLLNSIGSTFILVIWLLVVHYTAVLFFSGDAGMEVMFRRVIPLLTLYTVATTVVLAVMLVIGTRLENYALVPGILGVGSLLFFFYLVNELGRIYDFGFVSGCVTLVLAAFLWGIVWGCLGYLISL